MVLGTEDMMFKASVISCQASSFLWWVMPDLKSNLPDIMGSLFFTSWMMQSTSPQVKFGRRTLAGGEEDILNNNEGGRKKAKGR